MTGEFDALFTDDAELKRKLVFFANEGTIPFPLRDALTLFLQQRSAIALERVAKTAANIYEDMPNAAQLKKILDALSYLGTVANK